MLNIVLYQPEIPPNTGNIIRLCANTGARLHLIEPLGFVLEDKQLRRAGLDYHEFASITVHHDWAHCMTHFKGHRMFAITTRGKLSYDTVRYVEEDVLIFGPESRGLPQDLLSGFAPEQQIRLPMLPHSRSLNLSNTVAVMAYEAWRQMGFAGQG